MSFARMEGEIVDVIVGVNQVMRQRFSRHNFHLGNFFKIGLPFIGLMWLMVGNSEEIVPNKKYVKPRDLLDEFSRLIVIRFIHYRYTSPEHIAKMHQLVYALYSSTPHAFN